MKPLLSLSIVLFVCLAVQGQGRAPSFYQIESLGADPSETAAVNTAAIQTTLNTAGLNSGGTVTLTRAGKYRIATQGANPYVAGNKYCVEFKYNNVHLYLGSGVTLELEDGQQVNGAPVDMFIGQARSNITIAGASDGSTTITGNTAGQSWTGGYSQITNGNIIAFYGQSGGGANSHITVRDIALTDHFSNPINIDSSPSAARNSNIRIERVMTSDCGEGIQVIAADGVWIDGCLVESPNHVAVGDGIELSNCTNFYVTNNTVKNHRGGSGFDIFGSSNGFVHKWISDDNGEGVAVHAFSPVPDPHDVTVSDGLVLNPLVSPAITTGVSLSAATLNNIKVSNLSMAGAASTFGIQIGAGGAIKGTGSITIEDCRIDGGSNGILISAAFPNLTIKGGHYNSQVSNGILYVFQAGGLLANDVRDLLIDGVTATGNGGSGILLDNQGFTVPELSGSIQGCYLGDNIAGPINAGPEGAELTVDVLPNTKTALGDFFGTSAPIIYGVRYLTPTGGVLRTLRSPSKNQEVDLRFPEPTTVFDARQSGGNNFFLSQGLNGIFKAGDSLSLRYDGSGWREVSRSLNTP
jgi:hypothetical protein